MICLLHNVPLTIRDGLPVCPVCCNSTKGEKKEMTRILEEIANELGYSITFTEADPMDSLLGFKDDGSCVWN